MRRRKKHYLPGKAHITQDIFLELLKAGVKLTVAFIAPNAVKMFRPETFPEEKYNYWSKYYPSSINRHVYRLWRRGLVDIKDTSEGKTVTISDMGQKEILKFDIYNMEIPEQKHWDHRWRLVMFDISSDHVKKGREFRWKLKNMGFFQMQKSVYIYPYPCFKQLKYLREVYGIPHMVKLALCERLENDEDLRKIYSLN